MGAKRDLKMLFIRVVLAVVYCILGAGIFYAIEHTGGYNDAEVMRKEALKNQTKNDIMRRFGINDTEFRSLISKVTDFTSNTPLEWSFSRGIDLSWQAMTTIGYGNKTPVTLGGQIFLIPFALFGIPLTVFMLNTIGENISHLVGFVITRFEKNILKRKAVRNRGFKSLIVVCCFAIGLIVIMAAISTRADHWTFGQGLYVWFVTFTTIGFGDYIPGDDADDTSGIGVVLYRLILVVIGLSLIATIFNAIGDFMAEKRKKMPSAVRSCTGCCLASCWSKTGSREVYELEATQRSEMNDESKPEIKTKNGEKKSEVEADTL